MKRILLIEADSGLRAELQHTLENAGYGVEGVEGWAEAARSLRREPSDACLAGVDESSDLGALTRLLENESTPPVVALVTQRSLALSLELLRRGVRSVLRKPFELGRLEIELAAILGSPPRSPGVAPAFITRDPDTLAALRLAEALAPRKTTLVVQGESGTGKSLLARRVHALGTPHRAFASIGMDDPEGVRTELPAAEHAGTLLLRGIHQAPRESQDALADWLTRIHDAPEPRDAPRIIATTLRPIAECVERGQLRSDLAHRLDVVSVQLPPLRRRLCDLSALVRHFAGATGAFAESDLRCPPESLARLAEHPFKGNVRELENRVRRLAALRPEPPVDAGLLLDPDPGSSVRRDDSRRSLKELEREAIERSLARHGNNRTRASRELGISVRTLRNKLQRYGA